MKCPGHEMLAKAGA